METISKLIALRNEEIFFLQPLDLDIPFRNTQSVFRSIWEEI